GRGTDAGDLDSDGVGLGENLGLGRVDTRNAGEAGRQFDGIARGVDAGKMEGVARVRRRDRLAAGAVADQLAAVVRQQDLAAVAVAVVHRYRAGRRTEAGDRDGDGVGLSDELA